MNNGNRVTAIMAILCVSLVHAGAYIGLTAVGEPEAMMMQEGDAVSMTMHHFQLEGVAEPIEGNAEDSATESEEALVPEIEEPEIEEPIKEETPLEPEPESKPEPEPEPIKEPVKEPIVTTQAPSDNKVQQSVVTPEPKPEPKPIPKPIPKPEPKPAPKPEHSPQRQSPKPATASTARNAQSAQSVYSESDVSVLSKPTPGYPRAARQRRLQGTVDLLVGINENGTAYSVKIARSSGHDILDKAAEKAAQGIRLKPYRLNGVAQAIQVKIQYVFKM